MNLNHITNKVNGDQLTAAEWNALAADVNELGTAEESGSSSSVADTVISVSSKGNTQITSTKHINIEPAYDETGGDGTYGDIQLKPGDDITLESSHRSDDKKDEITIKTANGLSGASKGPVKLQVIAGDMTLSTKGKLGDDPNVMNVNVTTGSGKGYLKVRAQAIDLRCEDHGGIAIQPKGQDGDGNENKIKFEHGGGDGLEFGTFNTQHTSIYTNDYRFKKDGVIKLADRFTEVSDKADASDATTAYKYIKNTTANNATISTQESKTYDAADDFYDFVETTAPTCTWNDIIVAVNYIKSQNPSLDWSTPATPL